MTEFFENEIEYKKDCLFFNGYKPCRFKRSCVACPHFEQRGKKILIVSLEAMGAVLRTTCILKPLKRTYPNAVITWVTLPQSVPLLENNHLINHIIPLDFRSAIELEGQSFDLCLVVDKSRLAGSLAKKIDAKEFRGFGTDENGTVIPLNREAYYQYNVGLNDDLKFFKNNKTETQQITESMALKWERDEYVLDFTEDEAHEIAIRRQRILDDSKKVIGFSTGCSLLFPYKKFTVEYSVKVIKNWRARFPDHRVALYGGPEDRERNEKIAGFFRNDEYVVATPTNEGLRSGIMWMATADIILSGCSLGLHIAIALKKPALSWFGVSCSQEIELYDRGIKLAAKVNCSPCWRRQCDKAVKCYDMVDMKEIMDATEHLLGGLL